MSTSPYQKHPLIGQLPPPHQTLRGHLLSILIGPAPTSRTPDPGRSGQRLHRKQLFDGTVSTPIYGCVSPSEPAFAIIMCRDFFPMNTSIYKRCPMKSQCNLAACARKPCTELSQNSSFFPGTARCLAVFKPKQQQGGFHTAKDQLWKMEDSP